MKRKVHLKQLPGHGLDVAADIGGDPLFQFLVKGKEKVGNYSLQQEMIRMIIFKIRGDKLTFLKERMVSVQGPDTHSDLCKSTFPVGLP